MEMPWSAGNGRTEGRGPPPPLVSPTPPSPPPPPGARDRWSGPRRRARALAAVTWRGAPPRASRERRGKSRDASRASGREGGEGPARARRERCEKREGREWQHRGVRASGHASRVDPYMFSGPDGAETLAGMETWSRQSLK
ncbi:ubiquitin carboxyl-terminal hydrolase 51-like [Pyrgilauda ruficollis]|uniref:ubiquitin carboxyl-terminal hydrolase 51-like n=1 Tax=Pyrgilauda ruficollis TaxID=221976 RepID=UPI001B86EE80|nr:ubiquitin carboxyl-terminal hydrolase 51-like [Pyrgilauda ruficollis]